jgi:glycosyltransferase involved in cell wall biosynthesis
VATVTTVSRYMKQRMHEMGIEAVVIPNGLPAETFAVPDGAAVGALRRRMRQRTTVAKVARWDPDKRWLDAVETVGEMKRQGWRPLLLARGGSEPYGAEVIAAAGSCGLRVVERSSEREGKQGLLEALARVGDADVVVLRSHVDPEARRVLLRAADAVLANSRHEPFGLVGLETMASGGVACTGNTGEDYVVSGQNALVLETGEPREFMTLFAPLRESPGKARALRRAGMVTARRFAWPEVVERVLLPRVQLARDPVCEDSNNRASGLRPFGANPRRGVPSARRGASGAIRSRGSSDGASSGRARPEPPGD